MMKIQKFKKWTSRNLIIEPNNNTNLNNSNELEDIQDKS